MPLASGTRLGPFEIIAPLGVGGMGEVYRGRDAKLGRDVALKVLPDALTTDADYMLRFQREAQVLASLNHPNIAAIYGLEGHAIVMELVEGPTLADRVAQGPLPLDEVLSIARQIAEALEYAHDKGIVHRDLKPANVKVTPEGAVKVLDFGLAKIAESPTTQSNPATSPTLTVRAATQAGIILGTASYMAPEQARGHAVDRRADIWAFGAVLFELLTAQMAFPGDNITDILASVVKLEPDWNQLPASTPAPIRKLITRCLAKDRRRRLQAIGEARLAIEDYLADPSPAVEPAAAPAPPPPPQQRPHLWMALAAVLLLAATALAFVHFRETPPPERVLRYSIAAPEKSQIHSFTLSPDGRYLAIASSLNGKPRLYLRALDTLAPQELRGTEDAQYPFWSPDSRNIAFFAGGKLKRIAVDGAPPQILCDATEGRSGAWNRDGVIVFAPSNASPLHRVAAVGGVSVPITKVAPGEIHRFPVFLPDGQRFLYLSTIARGGNGGQTKTGIFLASLTDSTARLILPDQSSVSWVPHPDQPGIGYLLFHRARTWMAQPMDAKTLQPAGDLFPLAEQVGLANRNYVQATASSNGMLVFWSGNAFVGEESQLTWYDRAGKPLGAVGAPVRVVGLSLSPDQKTIALSRGASASTDIWLHEFARAVDTRFTFDAISSRSPVWSPDGRSLVYSAPREGGSNLYLKPTSGTGQDDLLLKAGNTRFPTDWSPDGKSLIYVDISPKGYDLWLLNMEDRKPTPLLNSDFNEAQGQFSPDGKWLAYASDESGRYEVYVRPFPLGDGKLKISVGGGELPRWRRDGKELYFLSPDRKFMSAIVKPAPQSPQMLFDPRVVGLIPGFNSYPYAPTADGKRFLFATALGEATDTPLTVVVNWLSAIKK